MRLSVLTTASASLLLAAHAHAAKSVTLGAGDGLALDQMQVQLAVIDAHAAGGAKTLGPDGTNQAPLDTGASSIIVSGEAASELVAAGLKSVAKYDEQGVAGFTEMDVSAPYEFDFAGTDGAAFALADVRFESSKDLDLGDFAGVVGMPAMLGRVVRADFTTLSGDNLSLTTQILSAPVPAAAHRYHAPFQLVSFPQSGQVNPGDPLPIDAPIPFVHVDAIQGGKVNHGTFLLDAGAQLSMISTAVAASLGIDPVKDKVDELPVGGIGGTVNVPLVKLGAFALKTSEGVDLIMTDLEVGVLDIDPSIAGVYGFDNLTSGWTAVFDSGKGTGYFQSVQYDFRNAASTKAGELLLDVTPALDVVKDSAPRTLVSVGAAPACFAPTQRPPRVRPLRAPKHANPRVRLFKR
jgi:hypothetical protein